MKFFTFIIAATLIVSFTFAQQLNNFPTKKGLRNLNKENLNTYQNKPTPQTKAPGDVIYSYDFNGSLPAGWTTTDNTGNNYVWTWSDIGPIGAYTGNPNWDDPIVPLASTTGANGFMLFPSDNYNTDQATGVIVPSPVDHNSYIETESLDFTGQPTVILTFQERYRCCCIYNTGVDLYADISNDGTTWTSFEVGSTYSSIADHSCGPTEVNQIEINISNIAGNEAAVNVRFRISGLSHYYWMIDDVEFLEGYTNDIILEKDYAHVFALDNGWYGKIPVSQCMYVPIAFEAAVYNYGTNAATNVVLNVDITHNGYPYYSENSFAEYPVPSLASLGRDTITLGVDTGSAWLPTAFTATEFGAYDISYYLSMDSVDQNPANDSAFRTFQVTNNVYARDGGILTGSVSPANWVSGGNNGDMFGISFDINNDTAGCFPPSEIMALEFYVHPQTTFTGTTPTIRGAIWMYDSGTGSFSEILTTDYYDIQSTDSAQWVTLNLIKDGFSEFLVPGFYLAVLEIDSFNGGDFYIGEDGNSPQSPIATFWKIAADTNFTSFSNYAKSIMLRANFEPCWESVGTISKLENVKMYPNPTTGMLNISNADGADVYIYNIMGDIVKTVGQINNTGKIDISNLSNGNYIVKLITEQGISTQKITLLK